MDDIIVQVIDESAVIEINSSDIVTIDIAGTQGPAGPGGVNITNSAIAGMTISSYHAVVLLNGLLYHADNSTISHANYVVGVSAQSGVSGNSIQYQCAGELSGGSFIQNTRYFVGLDGNLTSSIPQSPNWLKSIAIAKDNSTLVINLGQTILRG